MIARYASALHRPLSAIRIESYRPPSGTDEEMIINYLWNITLSESLYPLLAALEVSLRNSIHASASSVYHTEFWFDHPGLLHPLQKDEVGRARAKLHRSGKPDTAGRIIAQLTFGFWVGLLNRPYEEQFWHANKLALLTSTFPNIPRRQRNRGSIYRRIAPIRGLRNRVFHYEPIWNRPDLREEHNHILETLGWLSIDMRKTIALCDRFATILDHGRPTLTNDLTSLLETQSENV